MGVLKVELCDSYKNTVAIKYVKEFDIRENYIIEQSILRFSTNEPCIIYRTCIINSALLILEEFLRGQLKRGVNEIPLVDLPKNLLQAVRLSDNIDSIKIKN